MKYIYKVSVRTEMVMKKKTTAKVDLKTVFSIPRLVKLVLPDPKVRPNPVPRA